MPKHHGNMGHILARMVKLLGSSVVITGAASGMGKAMAYEFADRGANVVAVDVDEGGVNNVANEIGEDAIGVHGDVSDTDSMESVVETAVDKFGTIDVLCNNAGILDQTSVGDTSDDLWDRILEVNLNGPFYLTRAALPELQSGDEEGVVINMSSISGKAGGGGAAYTTSKHGVIGLTKHLTAAYAPDIRANAICPGHVKTGMTEDFLDQLNEDAAETPAKVPAEPEEIASVAVFLASDAASFIHGEAINVDGGKLSVHLSL